MVELPHVLVGGAIAIKVGNPALALPLAFASHFVLDLVPHWNPPIYKQMKENGRVGKKMTILIFLESSLALVSGLFIALLSLPDINRAIIILLGAFLAVLPDVVEIPYYFLGVRHPAIIRYVEFNHKIQAGAPLIPGIITQILVAAAAIWWMVG